VAALVCIFPNTRSVMPLKTPFTTTNITDALNLAVQHHQAGNLIQAELLYRQILQFDPRHADAHHLLGALAYQLGHHDQAVTLIRSAISLKPNAAGFHSNLGLAHQALGDTDAAVTCFQEALRLEPDAAEAHSNLANALLRQGHLNDAIAGFRRALQIKRHFADAHCGLAVALARQGKQDEALQHYQQALRVNPDLAEAHNNLGHLLVERDKLEEAVTHCRHALGVRPDYAEAHNNLGNALQKQDKLGEAIKHFEHALKLRPDLAEAHINLANTLKTQGDLDRAIRHCHEALRLQPDSAEAHNSLGNVLLRQVKLQDAIKHFEIALKLRPDFPHAHNNLGIALMSTGKQDEAMSHFAQAIDWQPSLPEAHYDRAILWLLRGDFENGWPEYEWRWRQPRVASRSFTAPLWDGSPLDGNTILIHAEQGLGDTLQFIRYLPLVKTRGGKVICECPGPLLPLLTSADGTDLLVARGTLLPQFDCHAPLLSLPRIFHTSLEDIPDTVPYLKANADLVKHWRKELEVWGTTFKVGIAWQGSAVYPADRQRSIPLAHFAPLAKVSGVQLISLQKGPGIDQLQALVEPFPLVDLGSRLDNSGGAFMETAAVMKCLDLVITSDTSIAHLAGALAVPVWVALPLVPDWRWLLERDDSPWYPSMHLFRQTRYGQWSDVFERMAKQLSVVSCQE
jgi:tetratricopeptide (TPR) repeat protein